MITDDIKEAFKAALSGDEVAAERLQTLLESSNGQEILTLKTNVSIQLFDESGNLKDSREIRNTVVTAGKNLILASGGTAEYPKQFSYIAIGTGTNASAITDTTLQTESARNISTVSNPSANTLQFTYTFPAGTGTGAVTESGLLDAVSSGNLFARQVFSAVNKAAADTLAITWQIT